MFQTKESKFVSALAFICFYMNFFRYTYGYVYEHKEHGTCNGRCQIGLPHNKRLMYSSVREVWHNYTYITTHINLLKLTGNFT